MKRRHIIYLIITALLAPQLVSALPRDPALFTSEHPQETLIETIEVFANSNSQVFTSALTGGRNYTFAVSGVYNVNSTRQGDGGFYSDNAWSSCSQNGTGLLVDGANYGDATKGLMCDRFNHKYQIGFQSPVTAPASLKIADPDGNRTNGNSGKLTVKVYLKALVTWTFTVDRPFEEIGGGGVVVDTRPYERQVFVPTQTVTLPPTPPIPLPEVIFEVKSTNPNDPACPRKVSFVLRVNGIATPIPLPGCFPSEADNYQSPYTILRPYPGTPGGDTQIAGMPITVIPGITYSLPLPVAVGKGTRIVVTFSWRADTSKMAQVASVTGGNEVWVPFAASSALWFADPANLASVGGTIGYYLIRPDGSFLFGDSQTIPGIGQIIEAMFANQVAGK
ncbi:MAG: hypothetical protein ABIS18_00210 [Actinomycetota bacterium]